MPTLGDVHGRHATRRFPVGDLTQLVIDLGSGRLIVRQLELTVSGAGRGVRLIREYRGREFSPRGFGPGWRLMTVPPTGTDDREPPFEDAGGYGITPHRDRDGLITELVDRLGRRIAAYTYEGGRLVEHRDATGRPTTFRWDAEDRLVQIGDAAEGTYTVRYDGASAVAEVEWCGDGRSGRVTFDRAGRRTSVTTDAGATTIHAFDERGRLVSVTDPLGNVRRWSWSGDLLRSHTDATGGSTAYEYDTDGRLVALRLPTSARSEIEYGDPANPRLPTVLRDPGGRELLLDYDASGRLVRSRVPGRDGALDTRTYAAHDRPVTITDGNGDTTSFSYDEMGNLVAVTPPAPMGVTRYTREGDSRIAGVTDGNGHRTGYRRDGAGRLTEVTADETGLLSLTYDGLGRVVRRDHADWSYEYRWTRTCRGSRIASAVRTARGEPTEEVRYEYSADGELTATTTAGGTTRYAYDKTSRLASVTGPTGRTAGFTHDAAGRLTAVDLGAAGLELTYDAAGRETSRTLRDGDGGVLLAVEYRYGADGADSDVMCAMSVDGEHTEYSYDELKRIEQAGGTRFRYDGAHHLVRLGDVRFTLNAAGQVSRFGETEFGYDGAGNFTDEVNPTGSFTYSTTHQVRTGVFGGRQVVDITYDGLGVEMARRITETDLDGVTVTHVLTWSELGVLRAVDDGVPTDFVRRPDGTLLAVITSDGRHHWAVTDHRGSVLALVDERGAIAARYRYTPHGAVTASGEAAAVNPFRFLGAYQLRRSAHLLDHRLYNGFWGRFTQPDPTRRSYAPYTFRDNDPVNIGTWTRHDFWSALVVPPERAVETFLPTLPEPDERQAGDPDGSAGPGVTPDRTPLVADEPAVRFPLFV